MKAQVAYRMALRHEEEGTMSNLKRRGEALEAVLPHPRTLETLTLSGERIVCVDRSRHSGEGRK